MHRYIVTCHNLFDTFAFILLTLTLKITYFDKVLTIMHLIIIGLLPHTLGLGPVYLF